MSPSTHQDSQKVPERIWMAQLGGGWHLVDPQDGALQYAEVETYIPISALLSDEAIRALAAFDDHGDYEAPVQALRDLLAAIEQVGGTEHGG